MPHLSNISHTVLCPKVGCLCRVAPLSPADLAWFTLPRVSGLSLRTPGAGHRGVGMLPQGEMPDALTAAGLVSPGLGLSSVAFCAVVQAGLG